jgi:hypothetical protein
MDKKNYYAIIPSDVRYDNTLKANAKLLYGEITALTNEKGFCWSSNSYFASLYDVSNRTISNWISQLEKRGYITLQMVYKNGTKEIDQRKIYLGDLASKNINRPTEENFHTHRKKTSIPPGRKLPDPMEENFHTPMEENFQDNNTYTNNTVNNTVNKKKRDLIFPFLSNNFLEQWQQWKIYKKGEFNFKYKTLQSEQAALNSLAKISQSEKEAIDVLHQSMENGWKGFFKLKTENNNGNTKTPKTGGIYSDDFKNRIAAKLVASSN